MPKLTFFSSCQFGFIKRRSTEDAFLEVSYIICNNSLNSYLKITGLQINFRKAFDMVDCDILFEN